MFFEPVLLPTVMAAPLLTRTTQNLHQRSLTQWATKPTKGLVRGSTIFLQQEEEHKKVAFRLTGEGKEDGAGTPCSELHTAPNRAQKKRLSQTYKSLEVRDANGERTERKKEEEGEGGFRWLTKTPSSSSTKKGGTGMGRPFKGPHPPRQSPSLDGRWSDAFSAKGGQIWRSVATEVFSEKLL